MVKKTKKVIIYTTTDCSYCGQAKEYFTKNKVPFEEINVSVIKSKQREMIEKSGQIGVPVIDITGRIVIGFDKGEVETELKKAKLLKK